MKSLRLIFWISVIVASIQPISGQKLPLKHYSTDNGLPSSETYSIFQDSKFRYWICTDNGISMFNGRSFTNFSIKDGLPTNTIFSSFENKKDGRIWFITYGFGVCYYDESKNKFSSPKFNDSLIKILNKKFINSCQFDEKGNLWITYQVIELLKIDCEGNISIFERKQAPLNVGFELQDQSNILIVRGRYDTITHLQYPTPKYSDNIIIVYGTSKIYSGAPKVIKYEKSKYVISYLDELFFINDLDKVVIKKMPSPILSLLKDYDNNLWIATQKNGIFIVTNSNFRSLPVNIKEFNDKSVSSLFQDVNGKIWFTTLTEGIFEIPNFSIKNFLNTHKVQKIFNKDNKTILITPLNKIHFSQNGESVLEHLDSKSEIKDIKLGPDNKIYVWKSMLYTKPPTKLDLEKIPFGPFEFLDKIIFFGGKNKYVVYDTKHNFKFTKPTPSPILKLCRIDGTRLLVGCLNGLFLFSNDTFIRVSGPSWLSDTRINELVKHGNDIYVLTDGKGILIYRDGTIIQPNLNNGAVLNSSNCLQFESNSLFWVGTNEGLFKAKLKSKNAIEIIQKLTINDGLPSNEINDIKIVDTKLYVATNNGLSVFDFNIKTTNRITPLFLDLLLGNFKDTLFNGYSRNVKLDLPKEWRNLYLKFSTNYDNTNKILGQISYRLIRNKAIINNWTNISDNNVQFTNLEPGNYKFQFRITDPILKEQYNSVATFTIQPYYYERFWVKVSFYVLLLALVILIVWMAFKKIKFDSEIKRKMISAEISSLRNQMNPHFIFNALNSIQYYIFENDEEQASKFLTKFSKLIRKSLEFSKLNFISIKAEIDFLNEYLEIEKVRFKNKFNYEINVDTEIEQDICKIPPLLMQPLIENSIKHGFSGATKNCMIWIKIRLEGEDTIVYSVRDNGKGIKTGKVNDPDYKTSLSHEILKERFVLLKNDFGKNSLLGMTINNHIFEGKYGTEIILKLPLKYD